MTKTQQGTAIEWTHRPGTKGETWNATTGCDKVSAGCDRCYAMTMAARLKAMGQPKYQRDGDPRTSGPGFGLTEHPDVLGVPLRWRAPRTVFVNSMSDLFHARVSREFLARVFAVMAVTPQHTYQILTKRPLRMSRVLGDERFWVWVMAAMTELQGGRCGFFNERITALPNVWLGVSVEDQQRADERIPPLLATPAAVRFLSCEPLLGPLNLTQWSVGQPTCGCGISPEGTPGSSMGCSAGCMVPEPSGLDWVIVGGESGPGARPMETAWASAILDQCRAAGVPAFMKQMGSAWGPHHHDIARFPAGLRVREYPAEVSR